MSLSLLLCRQCGVLHPVPARPAADDDVVDDLLAFRAAHEAHGLAAVQRLPDAALFDGPTWDPMSTRWFRVTAGADILLVRSWRSSIEEPRRFEVTAAPPPTADCIDVDEALLRRALHRHFYPHTIRPTKVEHVVAAVRELIAPLDPAAIETTFDDATLPNASIGPDGSRVCSGPALPPCTPFSML